MKNFFFHDPKLLFYGFSIILFASYGQTFFISIFNQEIRSFYQLSHVQFGLIYSLGTIASALLLVFFARLIDYVDLRIYSFIISAGLSIVCLGFFFLHKSIFFLFFLIFLLRFFGQGAMSHAGETTMARYFDSNRGKAISIGVLGGQAGVMFLPIFIVKLMNYITWQQVWLVASISIIIFFLPILFLSLQNQKIRHKIFLDIKRNKHTTAKLKIKNIFFDKYFYIYLPLTITTPFISTGLMFHQIFIISQKGWTLEMLAEGFVFLGFFSIIGLFFGGPIIDKYQTRKIVIFTHIPLLFGIFFLVFYDGYIYLLIYLSLLGLNLGFFSPFTGSLWAELYDLESLGTVKALLHAFTVFASALSPLVFGFIIDLGLGIVAISLISVAIIVSSTYLCVLYRND